MAASATERTLIELRRRGALASVVEKHNHFSGKKNDLYGFIDVLALDGEDTLAIQCTTGSNVSARVRKITSHENLPAVRKAGWRVLVWGWRKNSKGRWVLREVDLS